MGKKYDANVTKLRDMWENEGKEKAKKYAKDNVLMREFSTVSAEMVQRGRLFWIL
jgi:hypothetical protein